MENIRRNVRDLGSNERRVYEDVIGHELAENQQIIIQVITIDTGSQQSKDGSRGGSGDTLPDWCNVYAGLTDAETEEIESVVLQRSDMTRASE